MFEGPTLFVSINLSLDDIVFLKSHLQARLDVAILEILPVLRYPYHLIEYPLFNLGHLIGLSLPLRLFESDLDLDDSLALDIRIEVRIFHDHLVTLSIDIYAFDVILKAC